MNRAGYFVQPSAGNVAVALTRAQINPNLTQNLAAVYNNTDRRAYSMSSYSYMVIPTTTASPFNSDKGRTLSTFINYFLCGGQQKADILGYSPLPKNLVQAGFDQVKRIPGHVASPSISQCHNPALQILQTAPQPPACMKIGRSCTGTVGSSGTVEGSPAAGGGQTGRSGATSGGAGSGSVTGSGTSAAAGNGATGGGSAPGADPLTGGGATSSGSSDTVLATGAGGGVAVAIDPAAHDGSQTTAIAWLVVVSLALSVALPPILIRRLRLTGTLRTLWWVAAPVVGVWWFAHGVWRLPALYDRLISWVETVGRDRC